jgi:hypothetical protein
MQKKTKRSSKGSEEYGRTREAWPRKLDYNFVVKVTIYNFELYIAHYFSGKGT